MSETTITEIEALHRIQDNHTRQEAKDEIYHRLCEKRHCKAHVEGKPCKATFFVGLLTQLRSI